MEFQAAKLHINPLYFILTSTICVSYAFMLPVATPPNAIVFGTGRLKVIEMVRLFLHQKDLMNYFVFYR